MCRGQGRPSWSGSCPTHHPPSLSHLSCSWQQGRAGNTLDLRPVNVVGVALVLHLQTDISGCGI